MVTATGYRAYYVIYRPRGVSQSRAHLIGPAEDLSYKEAKSKAETIRGLVAEGKDPVGDEQAARKRKKSTRVVTVRDVVDYYLEVHQTKLGHQTVLGYQQTRDALPQSLLQEPAETVTPAMYRQAIKDVTQAPVMVNRYLSRLKAALRFARSESYIERLPALVEMRKPHSERKRSRFLAPDEIRALWEALDAVAPTMLRGGRAFLASVRTALLVGTRLGETSEAEWTELDLEGTSPRSTAAPAGQPMWYIPAEHRKGQTGKKVAHWIPLPPWWSRPSATCTRPPRTSPRCSTKPGIPRVPTCSASSWQRCSAGASASPSPSTTFGARARRVWVSSVAPTS
jgi:hypothetical protein